MKDFLSIKEFSRLSGIEKTTLRYWDDIGLFTPAKRDPENNYRYYTPEQIIAVNFVTVLSELNIPLKKIGSLEKERTPEKIVSLIEQQEKILDMEMIKLREGYSVIHSRLELIKYGKRLLDGFRVVDGIRIDTDKVVDDGIWVTSDQIAIMDRDEKKYILGPPNEWTGGDPFFKYFIKFCSMAEELRINLNFPIGSIHTDFDAFSKAPSEPNNFCSLDPTGNKTRPKGKYLVGFCEGYYGDFGDLAEKMSAYIKEKKLSVKGPVYTIYLFDEVCTSDTNKYLAQVSVAIS